MFDYYIFETQRPSENFWEYGMCCMDIWNSMWSENSRERGKGLLFIVPSSFIRDGITSFMFWWCPVFFPLLWVLAKCSCSLLLLLHSLWNWCFVCFFKFLHFGFNWSMPAHTPSLIVFLCFVLLFNYKKVDVFVILCFVQIILFSCSQIPQHNRCWQGFWLLSSSISMENSNACIGTNVCELVI